MRHVQTFGSKQLVPMTCIREFVLWHFNYKNITLGDVLYQKQLHCTLAALNEQPADLLQASFPLSPSPKVAFARSFMRLTEDCIRAINMCAYTWDTRKPLLGFSFLLLLSVQETHIVVCPEIITRMLKKPHLSLFHWSLMRTKQFLILDCR